MTDRQPDLAPFLLGKALYFRTGDGSWCRLGNILTEEYRATANGPAWTFQLDNGAWVRDFRHAPRWRTIDATPAAITGAVLPPSR